jgi:hypothetical protein
MHHFKMNKDIISTHVSHGSGEDFSYKNKSRWPKLSHIIYDVEGLFNTNVFFYREDLLKSRYISPTYKKRIAKLQPGNSCEGNSNGGGRWEHFRALTQEDVNLLLERENLQQKLISTKEELRKAAPNLIESINEFNNKLAKLQKILQKENLK